MAKGQIKPEYERSKKDGRLEKLFDGLKGGMTRKSAIAYAGINIDTVYDWIETMPDFAKKMVDCEEYRMAIVENAKRKKIVDEQYRPAIEKELESKRFETYGKRIREEQNIKIEGELTEEQISKIVARFTKK